jgi:hypothetical protein
MTAKLRHASKTGHYKHDFENNKSPLRREEMGSFEDMRHMKGLSDNEFLQELFLRREF